MRKFIAVALGLVALLAAWSADAELRLIRHLELTDDGGKVGQFVIVDRVRQDDDSGGLTAGLLELEDGTRIIVSQRMDLVEGASYERVEDLSAGWWIERKFDYGFGNLSDPADFHDPMQAAIEIGERARREKAPETYIVTLSNGARVEWAIPWGESTEGGKEKQAALADLAVKLVKEPLPVSMERALRVLVGLHERSQPVEIVAENVIKLLWHATRVAHDNPPVARTVQVVEGSVEEHPRLFKAVKRNLERE